MGLKAVASPGGNVVVLSLNGLTGAINLTSVDNTVTITPSGNSIDLEVASGADGIQRNIASISVNTNAGSAANTDYVYFASNGCTLTLPTAIGNTNLYEIINTDGSAIQVATSSGQTISGSASPISAPLQEMSLSIQSNNTNWNIV